MADNPNQKIRIVRIPVEVENFDSLPPGLKSSILFPNPSVKVRIRGEAPKSLKVDASALLHKNGIYAGDLAKEGIEILNPNLPIAVNYLTHPPETKQEEPEEKHEKEHGRHKVHSEKEESLEKPKAQKLSEIINKKETPAISPKQTRPVYRISPRPARPVYKISPSTRTIPRASNTTPAPSVPRVPVSRTGGQRLSPAPSLGAPLGRGLGGIRRGGTVAKTLFSSYVIAPVFVALFLAVGAFFFLIIGGFGAGGVPATTATEGQPSPQASPIPGQSPDPNATTSPAPSSSGPSAVGMFRMPLACGNYWGLTYKGHTSYAVDFNRGEGDDDYGDPVLASAQGRVKLEDRPNGQVAIIHSGGYVTRYAHMINIIVADGQEVQPGDKIGEIGDMCGVKGSCSPHLHLGHFRGNGNYPKDKPIQISFNGVPYSGSLPSDLVDGPKWTKAIPAPCP